MRPPTSVYSDSSAPFGNSFRMTFRGDDSVICALLEYRLERRPETTPGAPGGSALPCSLCKGLADQQRGPYRLGTTDPDQGRGPCRATWSSLLSPDRIGCSIRQELHCTSAGTQCLRDPASPPARQKRPDSAEESETTE